MSNVINIQDFLATKNFLFPIIIVIMCGVA
jgi:hypothetical protein